MRGNEQQLNHLNTQNKAASVWERRQIYAMLAGGEDSNAGKETLPTKFKHRAIGLIHTNIPMEKSQETVRLYPGLLTDILGSTGPGDLLLQRNNSSGSLRPT